MLAALLSACANAAADPVFPQGSRIGLAPPAGMVLSKAYSGFEDAARNVRVILNEVPAEAVSEVEKGFTAEELKTQGLLFVRRDDVKSKDWHGFVVEARQDAGGTHLRKWILVASGADAATVVAFQVPEDALKTYPDTAVRAALMSTVFRPIPVAERLAMLPYGITNLAGFRLLQASPEGTALLTDGPKEVLTRMEQPFLLITIALGQTPPQQAYDGFARQVISTVPGLKDMHVLSAQPLTIGAQPSYEVVAAAKTEAGGADITLVQWLRFGGTGYLRLIGVAPRAAWAAEFPRLRAIRDSVGPK
jgi:hypothetical protein